MATVFEVGPSEEYRVYVSGVSSEFERARSLVSSDLRSRGLTVRVQDDFRQEADTTTTLQKLNAYIADCHAVVCLIGVRSGEFPTHAEAEPHHEMLPTGFDELSYTQWELVAARHHGCRLSVHCADSSFVPSRHHPVEGDKPAQQRFASWLFDEEGLDRDEFATANALRVAVLRQDWPTIRPDIPIVLPYPSLETLFQGRLSDLEHLDAALDPTRPGQPSVHVVHGLGGVGKTRLAVEYGWRHLDSFSAVLFVAAESPEVFAQSLAALSLPNGLRLASVADADQDSQIAAVIDWLTRHGGWLLIIDDIDTPQMASTVQRLLPKLRGGHVLVTGRLTDWPAGMNTAQLDVLDVTDAAAFLEARSERRTRVESDSGDVVELAKQLDGLALALEQAGAYIDRQRLSFAEYLGRWRSQEKRVRAWFDERLMNYPASVAVTWQTTIDTLGPTDRAVLRLIAWLAPEPLPVHLIDTDAASELLTEATARLGEELNSGVGQGEALTIREALANVAGFSMISWDGDTIEIHGLVQEVVRDRIPVAEKPDWIQLAERLVADAVADHDPTDPRSWIAWDPLRPHAAAVIDHAESVDLAEPTAFMLDRLATLLRVKGIYNEAEPLSRRALAIDEANQGTDHPDVARDLNNLASLLRATNRLPEAEQLYRRALVIDEAYYGPDHPTVARDLNNLALLLHDTNRLPEAEPLHQRALAIDEAFYGPDHIECATDLNNLAMLLHGMGRSEEAEPLCRRALAIDEADYEPGHPTVARDLSTLAILLHGQGQSAEAEPLCRQALAIHEASYGPDHPTVARDLSTLAALLHAMDRSVEAEEHGRRSLTILVGFKRHTGHDHRYYRFARAAHVRLLTEIGRTSDQIRVALGELGLEAEDE